TWLAVGAVLQLATLACLPIRLSYLIPSLYLTSRVIKTIAGSRQPFVSSFRTVKRGKWTGELTRSHNDNNDNGMVMFVLGARINHPLGPLAPGNHNIGRAFEAMWIEAETNCDKWGFLGHTGTLRDTTDSEGITMTWLSYWKNVEGLRDFAKSSIHQFGVVNYNKKKYPYMGIMHETYHAPSGHWETIYGNMPP
ncbi:hypothetical protein P280DRAFT_385428, partial [Massarina eburnea CBS 473.64]